MTRSVRKADNLLIKHYPGFLLQENHYFPFGLLNKALSSDEQKGFNQRYGFNGKEFEKGLDWRVNDFGARMYDPVLGRWGSVDPKAAKFAFQSPFVYCNNNPIYYIDPDGREGIAYIDHTNKTVNVKAVYFTEVGKYGFSADNYKQLQGINNTLNSQGYSITDKANALSGYSVKFELQFIPVTSEKHAQSFAVSEQQLTESNATGGANLIESGFNIGNSLILTTDAAFENIPAVRSTAAANSVSPDKVLGITDVSLQHINIPEKSRGNEKTAIHEIFHTLYFNKGNAKSGIGSGKQLPTNEDINGLIQGMQKIERTVEQKR